MSLSTEIDAALGQMIAFAGEEIVIYPPFGDSHTVNALVTGGSFDRIGVPGGFYDEIMFNATVRKSDLGDFVPEQGMLVDDARGNLLRIDNNGVIFYRAHYQLRLVSRTSPR